MVGRTLTATGVTLVIAAGILTTATPAHARNSAGVCPDSNGVTVVVDYQELGGGVVARCAHGDQDSGLAALKNAGFSVTGTDRWGESFICRINGKPGADTEPCVDTPPTTAYWSYWHSPNNGTWTYSQWGATNRTPPPGSFEGWSFAKDKNGGNVPPPGFTPKRTDPEPDPGNPDDPNRPGDPTQDSPTATKTPGKTKTPTDEPSASTPGPSDTPVEESTWTDRSPTDPTTAAADGGIPGGAIAGLATIALLTAAAITIAKRRRTATDD